MDLIEDEFDDRSYDLRVLGWVHLTENDVEFDEVPIGKFLLRRLKEAGISHLIHDNQATIRICKIGMSVEAVEAIFAVNKIDPSVYLGHETEDFETTISQRALARLFLLRDQLYGEPKNADEAEGATKMLLALDAIIALDEGRINDLLGGEPCAL